MDDFAIEVIKSARRLCCCLTGQKAQILSRLEATGSQNVTELYQHFGIVQSTMSQMLNELRAAGLVVVRPNSAERYYELHVDNYHTAIKALLIIQDLAPKK